MKIADLQIVDRYLSPSEVMGQVPSKFQGKTSILANEENGALPIDVEQRRGKLLFSEDFSNEAAVQDWVREGPVHLRFENDAMLMTSAEFAEHVVLWCPEDFPESFVAEWEFDPVSHYGLAIVFFAACGEHGEDIFDPTLPARDGQIKHYIKGAIESYHISYFANVETFQMGRVDSNLRKNNNFYRVGKGPVSIPPNSEGWQKLRLVKDGNRILFYNNNKLFVDWTDDDPERYGVPLSGGKIGFRQMTPTVGLYRNFKVWSLQETPVPETD